MESTRLHEKGAPMRAFFDTNIHPEGYHFVRLYENSWGENLPLIGLSEGWVPASVAEEYSGTGDVLVRLHGSFADPYAYNFEGPVRNLVWRVHPNLVLALQRKITTLVDLSLVVVRWMDYRPDTNEKRKGRSYNVLNENLIRDVLHGDGSFRQFFGSKGNYEVLTIFVKTSDHLNTINVSTLSGYLRGKQRAALYFLWPTQNESPQKNGMVAAAALESLMRRMETADIKTCWPHAADFYFQLVSKSLVLPPTTFDFNLPPTTLVRKQDLQPGQEAQQAAGAIERLQRWGSLHGKQHSKETYRGVVKLGFSSKGYRVLPFVGEDSLKKAFLKLLDEASSDAHCLVQERVEGVVCEMRAFCCQDMVKRAYVMKLVIMSMKGPQHGRWDKTFCTADTRQMTAEDLAGCFGGDMRKAIAIHDKVKKLANLWLNWIQERYGAPQCIRLDFMISRQANNYFQVHTCALKECGVETCGLEVSPRTVAVVNRAAEGIAGFPKPLPLRSEGWENCGDDQQITNKIRSKQIKMKQINKSRDDGHQVEERGAPLRPTPNTQKCEMRMQKYNFSHLVEKHTSSSAAITGRQESDTTPHPTNPHTLPPLWTNLALWGIFAALFKSKFRNVKGVDAFLLRSLVATLGLPALRLLVIPVQQRLSGWWSPAKSATAKQAAGKWCTLQSACV